MLRTFSALLRDEAGFLVSAELVIVATILVIGLVVGLAELQGAIIHELNDVGEAFGSLCQSYGFPGYASKKGNKWAYSSGSAFNDVVDSACCDQISPVVVCDSNCESAGF